MVSGLFSGQTGIEALNSFDTRYFLKEFTIPLPMCRTPAFSLAFRLRVQNAVRVFPPDKTMCTYLQTDVCRCW